jgi:hypothetical protein
MCLMLHKMEVGANDTIAAIESALLQAEQRRENFVSRIPSDRCEFRAKMAMGRTAKQTSFRDVWSSFALASLNSSFDDGEAIAWGIHEWEEIEDSESISSTLIPYSPVGLYSVGSGLSLKTDTQPRVPLDAEKVMQSLRDKRFVIGSDGASERVVVEFDSGVRTAPPLQSDQSAREKFRRFILKARRALEIDGNKKHVKVGEEGAAGALTQFLYELRLNGLEHAVSSKSVRFMKLKKRHFNNRSEAAKWADDFPQLASYISTQYNEKGEVYIVEVTVSDFGPGIVDGFLDSPRGQSWPPVDRAKLLDDLLLTPLSSKWNDPGAGYGIKDALMAAHTMSAFVSLRTGEFWKYQDSGIDGKIGMRNCSAKPLAKVSGTHWQMVYPHIASL